MVSRPERKEWRKPELKRIIAGSAEGKTDNRADATDTNKS
jgi:hypothetical protein